MRRADNSSLQVKGNKHKSSENLLNFHQKLKCVVLNIFQMVFAVYEKFMDSMKAKNVFKFKTLSRKKNCWLPLGRGMFFYRYIDLHIWSLSSHDGKRLTIIKYSYEPSLSNLTPIIPPRLPSQNLLQCQSPTVFSSWWETCDAP